MKVIVGCRLVATSNDVHTIRQLPESPSFELVSVMRRWSEERVQALSLVRVGPERMLPYQARSGENQTPDGAFVALTDRAPSCGGRGWPAHCSRRSFLGLWPGKLFKCLLKMRLRRTSRCASAAIRLRRTIASNLDLVACQAAGPTTAFDEGPSPDQGGWNASHLAALRSLMAPSDRRGRTYQPFVADRLDLMGC